LTEEGRADVPRKRAETCPGMSPGANPGKGRDELAFPAPVRRSFVSSGVLQAHVTGFLGESRFSPRYDQEVRR
jgi:hypothetical protein